METYLFVYRAEGEFVKTLATAAKIAETIGCRDFNETSDHRVYRVNANGVHQLNYRDYPGLHCVDLFDVYGNPVDSGTYPEH